MAISPLVKVNIVGALKNKGDIIKYLQELGLVHITQISDVEIPFSKITSPEIDLAIQEVSRLIDNLSRYEKKGGFIKNLLPAKFLIHEDRFNKTTKDFDYRPIWEEYRALEKELNTLNEKEHHLRIELSHLRNWQGLDVEFKKIKPTRNTVSMIGTIPFTASPRLLERCKEIGLVSVEAISEPKFEKRLFICYHKDVESSITDCLKECNFSQFRDFISTEEPISIIGEWLTALSKIPEQREDILKKLDKLTRYIPQLSILYDYYINISGQKDIQERFIQTRATILIEGWIKMRDMSYIRRKLEKLDLSIELVKPGENEIPPVAIENKRLVRPFEIITNLYGLPARYEFDPTPAFMPFFLLFFAICLTDAGYGLVLSLFSFILLKKLKVGKVGKKFLRLLLILGIATIIVGLLTGGIFGIDFNKLSTRWDWLKVLREKIMLFDPMQDPMLLFIIALGLGFIQIWFGFFLRMLENFRIHRYLDGMLDQGPWLGILSGILLLLSPAKHVGIIMILSCILVIIIFQGRDSRNIFVRFFKGLYALYGVTGIIGDILSYSRLLALGLATGVLAMVVNTIALLVIEIPVIGPVAMIGILIGGHIFTIAINALGGFIHCTRLQFVEFFTKFYHGGGEPFKPFAKSYKYTIIGPTSVVADV